MKKFQEEKVTVEGKYPLAGTLAIPEGPGPFPAVLLVAGSGTGDRDGNVKEGKFFPNMYKDLAELISGLGFITLRVDKRGAGESGGNFLETGMMDLVDDIESNIAFLENHPQVNKIILLGHSEGCTLITAANARRPVDGLIFLSGAAESTKDALKRQRKLAADELLNMKGVKGKLVRLLKAEQKIEKQAQKLNDKIMNSSEAVVRFQLQKMNAKWFREHFTYNVFEDLKKVTCPSLAITGSKDIQVTPEKVYDLPSYVQGPTESYVIENMDHILKEVSVAASVLNVIKDYKKNENKPLHPELKKIISQWLQQYI
ncbi:alpha/beta hydrolase [Dethiobacter alkaliphilus]|uniref:alpha/beta hydrolase n=1 Tax=Dethiobacter alkaliphilus TaxID=427926 RepID=UPI002227FBC2|nr:alpha/beta hydrolase [Dethiobacter alkaliphilus]MCW3488560.1 lysophospholipase [Dethiobacter alkaliphilus]